MELLTVNKVTKLENIRFDTLLAYDGSTLVIDDVIVLRFLPSDKVYVDGVHCVYLEAKVEQSLRMDVSKTKSLKMQSPADASLSVTGPSERRQVLVKKL